MKQIIYEGKSKIVYQTEDADTCIIAYKDTATAGNGEKKAEFSDKGRLNAAISNIIFDYLGQNGIKTHMVKTLDETSILAKKVEIIPIEVIVRNLAAGGFSKKYGVQEGASLKNTVLEYCLKSDELGDPMINDSQITALGLATEEELSVLSETARRINSLMSSLFASTGITLVDFKLEFGRCKGEILLSDEISPDSCRLWDAKTHQKLDKDVFRRDLGDVMSGYKEVLRRLSDVRSI